MIGHKFSMLFLQFIITQLGRLGSFCIQESNYNQLSHFCLIKNMYVHAAQTYFQPQQSWSAYSHVQCCGGGGSLTPCVAAHSPPGHAASEHAAPPVLSQDC